MRGRAGPFFATLALAGVLALAAFPAEAWLDQRTERKALAAKVAVLSAENRSLEDRVAQLGSDEEIERLARQYNLVKPGEEAYFIRPRAEPPTTVAPAPAAEAEAPPKQSRSLLERIRDVF